MSNLIKAIEDSTAELLDGVQRRRNHNESIYAG